MKVVVIVRADADDLELRADRRAFEISLVVVPCQAGVAAVGVGNVNPIKRASVTMIATLGIDGFLAFTSEIFLAQRSLFLNAARPEMNVWIEPFLPALCQPLPDPIRKIRL